VECNISEDTEIAPTLIFHGTKDRTVNTYNSVDLYRKMKNSGKDVTFYLVRGADHGGAEFWTPEILDIVDAFIKRCLANN
jgi:dipeptidyl aminopeptidase/acylaminoacyl peptidase